MGPDEFDQHTAESVRHMNDQSAFVASKIEDNAIVSNEINRRSELTLDIAWALPPRLRDNRIPRARRSFGLAMPLPELLKRPASDHLHPARISCHQIGDNGQHGAPIAPRHEQP